MKQLFMQAKRLVPKWMKNQLNKNIKKILIPKEIQRIERDLGNYILDKAKDFCRERGGNPESLQASQLMNIILHQNYLKEVDKAHQYLQTAFMPNYQQQLYEFYSQQQYLILLTFLGYPFRGPGCLSAHIEPYNLASSNLQNMRILDYGAGLPFGIIHLLKTCPQKVEYITIVDLDIIHIELVEYILNELCTNTKIDVIKVIDPESVPDFGNRSFNFIYGKDIFEHLFDPERHIRAILDKAQPSCQCYFDFRDHQANQLQHIHPKLSHLSDILLEYSFNPSGYEGQMTKFVRTA